MSRLSLLILSGWLVPAVTAPADDPPRAKMPERHRAFLNTHCLRCHDAKTQRGKFRLDDLPFVLTDAATAERWQKVLNALNAGEMPPEGQKQPANEAKADFLDELANVMVTARKSLGDQKGLITMRRLNRREYRNTLRELLGVEINVSELPADVGAGGFDTVGTNLFMSSNQFEQYLALGLEALEEAFDRQAGAGLTKRLRVEGEESLPAITKYIEDALDATERGKKWVAAVMAAANKPENKAIVAKLPQSAKDNGILRHSWAKIPGAPSPESYGFQTAENSADLANRAAKITASHAYYKYYLKLPALERGAYLTIGQGDRLNSWINLQVPNSIPVGDYIVRIRIAATDDAPPERRFLEFGINPRHGQVLSTHQIVGTMAMPQTVEIPWTLTRKHTDRSDRTLFIREKGTNDHIEQVRRLFGDGLKANGVGPPVALWVDWFEIEYRPVAAQPAAPGLAALAIPLDDRSKAPTAAEVRTALERFSLVAFRGVAPPRGYVDRLLALYETRRQAGAKHAAALKHTLAVVLASPMFLYLAEPADAQPQTLNDPELAVRLAYFLWSAPPDATLRDLAARGELRKPAVLAAQTTRLLDDPRAHGFVTGFVYQWLNMDRLDFFQINRTLFPRFDNSVKLAARNEVYETFAYELKHNVSIRDLLKADYVVINSVLANYYGVPGVTGDDYRKVPVPRNSPRGGLLGMAAINVMGGNGETTSPVERGAWVLRKLLNDPPPPAPANVPAITRLAGKALTTRERLLAHQELAQCASCHRKIDPIGFGLENFDAAGQWRTRDRYQVMDANGKPRRDIPTKTWTIDPAGSIHKGPAFRDYFELRDLVAARSDAFARGFSAALLEYGLGRPVGFHDEPLLAEMQRHAHSKDYAMRAFIHALVASQAFRTK